MSRHEICFRYGSGCSIGRANAHALSSLAVYANVHMSLNAALYGAEIGAKFKRISLIKIRIEKTTKY